MSPLIVNGRTEKEILKACLKGDRQAQKDMFHLYAEKMMAVCLRYARNHQEAEDMLQDGFIKVFTNMHNFEHAGSFEGWIRRIVVNTAIKYTQKKSFTHEDNSLDYVEDHIDPEALSMLTEAELIKLISELPEGYKVVFNLYAIEGYSHREISELLNIDESTSRSQLLKARRLLQTKVQKLYIVAV